MITDIIGALLIIVTAILADKASERWKKPLWALFTILVLGQTYLQVYTRKSAQREARLQEHTLGNKIDATQGKLDKAQETLTASLLAQERMKGQLDALGMVAGKIGQNSSTDMKQLVAAVTKVADTGHVGTLTNKQLCDRAFDLAKRLRAFGKKAYDYSADYSTITAQWQEMASAKTPEGKKAIWQKQTQEEIRKWNSIEMEFRSDYVAEAIYLRDEIVKKLPTVPPPHHEEGMIFKGMSGGSWGVFGAADYFERLARTLCPK